MSVTSQINLMNEIHENHDRRLSIAEWRSIQEYVTILRDVGEDYVQVRLNESGLEAIGLVAETCHVCKGEGETEIALPDGTQRIAFICTACRGEGTIYTPKSVISEPPAEPDYDRYINERERQHEATLDAVEDEADLKAYRAEHGDDAPDPMPIITEIPTDDDGNPIWKKEPRREYYVVGKLEIDSLNEQLTAQLATARATQDQLRDELTVITAERDELKAARELWTALRREIWELVQQADFDNPLANELEALLK